MEFETKAARVIVAQPTPGYVEYEIDVEKVLRDELPGVLERTQIAPLDPTAIIAIPHGAKGAYVLFENGHPVYAGKTDVRHGFRARLSRHYTTLQHRVGFTPAAIGFKAVRILVFSNFDVEAILIKEMQRKDATALRWNFSGFGSNDPGHNRETQEPADFDKERPIDIDMPIQLPASGTTLGIIDLLVQLKESLPYTFRYETDLQGRGPKHRVGHADHRNAPSINLPDGPISVREALRLVLRSLPSGWQATIFPDRVILYREKVEYRFAREYIVA